MAGPITWRTVNGPSLAEAGRPLESAQRSFDSAFTGLGGLLKQTEATDAANWNQAKENNTQDFLNKLYSAQGAKGFKALQDSGELDRMLAANGAQIDRAAARSAMDGRLSTLQQRDKQGWEFANAALDQQESPVVNQVKGLLAQGNLEGAKPLIASLSARGQATMLGALDQRERQLVERARGDTEFGWKGAEEAFKQQQRPLTLAVEQGKVDNIPLQRDQLRAQINSSNASAAASNESVLTSRANRDRIEAEADKARELKKLGAALDGNIYKEGVYKDSDSVDIAKLMKDTGAGGDGPGDNDQRRKVLERINKLAQTGVELTQAGPDGKPVKTTVPLPLGAVKAALLSSGDKVLSWNEGYADSFQENLEARLQAVYNKPGADGRPTAANKAADDYQNFLAIMRGTAEIAPAPSTKRK
jgi:hypothetical protein